MPKVRALTEERRIAEADSNRNMAIRDKLRIGKDRGRRRTRLWGNAFSSTGIWE